MENIKNRMLISMLPLETERLKMRRTELRDTELLVKMDHNENVQRFLGGIKNSTVCSRHMGYCTEAAKKLVQIGFENLKLHRIYADTISGNIGSIKVLQKIGMIREGEI